MLRPIYLILQLFLLIFLPSSLGATEPSRFFFMGDGTLVLSGQTISYRNEQNEYLEDGLKRINQLFGAPWSPEYERLSLRFVEILDYVQDQLQGGSYQLRSGYRSPPNNQSLRAKGKLAAQSSMHVEAVAGDLFLSGVPSAKVFEFVKALNCCGIGWYHSKHFHLDSGPPRYWDEKTSKTEDQIPQQNEKIILQGNWDRVAPGETLALKFMRVSNYPIGVPDQFTLVRDESESRKSILPLSITYSLQVSSENSCRILQDRAQARQISITLPKKDLPPGKYSLEVAFCNRYGYERMPETIHSRSFEIIAAGKKQ